MVNICLDLWHQKGIGKGKSYSQPEKKQETLSTLQLTDVYRVDIWKIECVHKCCGSWLFWDNFMDYHYLKQMDKLNLKVSKDWIVGNNSKFRGDYSQSR